MDFPSEYLPPGTRPGQPPKKSPSPPPSTTAPSPLQHSYYQYYNNTADRDAHGMSALLSSIDPLPPPPSPASAQALSDRRLDDAASLSVGHWLTTMPRPHAPLVLPPGALDERDHHKVAAAVHSLVDAQQLDDAVCAIKYLVEQRNDLTAVKL